MKLSFFTILIVFQINICVSQVGIGTDNPESSLDVRAENHLGSVSENDGVLVPRVTDLSIDGINSGQLVFLTVDWVDDNGTPSNTSDDITFRNGFHYWNSSSTAWTPIDTTVEPWNRAGTNDPSNSNSDNIYTLGQVGIGTNNPLGALHITTENSRDVLMFRFIDRLDDDLDIDLFRSRGTVASPSLLLDDTYLGGLRGQSITNTSAYTFRPSAEIYFQTEGASSATSSAGEINFATTPVGSTSTQQRMTIKSDGRVGIGINEPSNSSILDLSSSNKGFLAPRINIPDALDTSVIPSPATGLLVFNTVSSGTFPNNLLVGYHYYDGSRWRSITDTPINRTVKFRNNNTSTNFSNSSGVNVDIFNSLQWNEDTSIFNKINNTTLQILEPGYYEVNVNLSLFTSSVERYLDLNLRINGVDSTEVVHALAPEDGGSDERFSVNFTQTVFIDRNQTLNLRSTRVGSSATITFSSAQSSSITIKKLR